MTFFLAIILLVMIIALVIFDRVFVSRLRAYFNKNHPAEWDEFIKAKPRLFFLSMGEFPWSWDPNEMNRFVKKKSSLSADLSLKKQISFIRTVRFVIIVAMVVILIFLSLLSGTF